MDVPLHYVDVAASVSGPSTSKRLPFILNEAETAKHQRRGSVWYLPGRKSKGKATSPDAVRGDDGTFCDPSHTTPAVVHGLHIIYSNSPQEGIDRHPTEQHQTCRRPFQWVRGYAKGGHSFDHTGRREILCSYIYPLCRIPTISQSLRQSRSTWRSFWEPERLYTVRTEVLPHRSKKFNARLFSSHGLPRGEARHYLHSSRC